MAERVGFEPTIPVKVCPLSRRIVSTTHAPLRDGTVVSRQLSAVSKDALELLTTGGQPLTPISKERLQHFLAATGQYPASNLQLVVQPRVIYDLHHRAHCPGFWVVGAIDQALDASVNQGAGAHGARFNCNKQVAGCQAVITEGCTGFAQSDDLGVGGGVGVRDVAVPAAAYDFSVADHDRTDGNLAHFQSPMGTTQSFFHPDFVGAVVGCWYLVGGHSVVGVILRGEQLTPDEIRSLRQGSNHGENISDHFRHDGVDYSGHDYAGNGVGDRQCRDYQQ